jgi:hypothetical protein
MKRLIALAVLLLLVFYVAWPGWTGYQIAGSLKSKDEATLARKISFPDVRETLKPATVQKIGEFYDQFKQQVPFGAAVAGSIKSDVGAAIADQALKQIVTPGNLIRVVNDGGTLKQNAERILQEQIGKLGGLPGLGNIGGAPAGGGAGGGIQLPGGIKLPGGLGDIAGKMQIPGIGGAPKQAPPPAPAAGAEQPAQSFGLSNIKRFGFLGPLAFEIGVAKDAAAKESDVLVEMRFVGGDWRVVGVKPRI